MKRQAIILLTILFSMTACHQQEKAKFSPPQTLNDGWTISTADKEGLDQHKFEQIISSIPSDNPKLDGIVIVRHGKLIADQYFNGYSADKLHKIWSITKAVSGTVVGIAADNGLLSENDSIYKYLGDYLTDTNSTKRAITIEHLITMTSGFEWVELGGPTSSGFRLAYSSDWIEFTLDQAHTNVPGEVFTYSTGNTMLLGQILKSATGQQAKAYAKENLFSPLGITQYEWDTQSEFWSKTQGGELPGAKRPEDINYKKQLADLTNTGTGLRLRPRDMCKLGQLYLNNGKWNDQQVVSKKWIEASTQPHFGNIEYGYHWRLMTFQDNPCYYATGFGLQRIFVFPTLDLIIVLTQSHYETMPQGNELTSQLLEDILNTL